MKINENDIIGDVLDSHPKTAELFLAIGMHCLGCPSARGETVGEACQVHGVDCQELLNKINAVIEA